MRLVPQGFLDAESFGTITTPLLAVFHPMKSVSGKDFANTLEKHGWTLFRIKGSHHIYGKTGSEVRISVPIHGNQALKTGLLRHFMKLSGLTEGEL